MFHKTLLLRKYWFRRRERKERELCFSVCRALNIPICFMHANLFISNFFGKFNQARFLRVFWQLNSWHLIFHSNTMCFLVLSFLTLCGFSVFDFVQHTRSCAVSIECGDFYLMLVIDCRKVNIERMFRDCSPQTDFRPGTGQTVLSSIERKAKSFCAYMREWWFTKHNKLCFYASPPSNRPTNISIKSNSFRRFSIPEKFHRHLNDKLMDIEGSSSPPALDMLSNVLCCVHLPPQRLFPSYWFEHCV